MNIDLSLIIPCYDEEKNVPLIVERIKRTLPKGMRMELILVDNGSSDNTNKLIRGYARKYSFVKLVEVKKNKGYGFGVISGLNKAKGEFLSFTHGDMQTDPYDAIIAYQLMKKQIDQKKCLVKGVREKRPFNEKILEVSVSIIDSVIMRRPMWDVFAVPSLFHRDFWKLVVHPPLDHPFDIHLYYLAKKMGFKIIRFPVIFPKRMHGKSHWNKGLHAKWNFLKMIVRDSLKIKKIVKNHKG